MDEADQLSYDSRLSVLSPGIDCETQAQQTGYIFLKMYVMNVSLHLNSV